MKLYNDTLSEVEVTEGETIALPVAVSLPTLRDGTVIPVKVQWSFENGPADTQVTFENVTTQGGLQLVLKNASLEHDGTYSVEVTSPFGQVVKGSVHLTVNCKGHLPFQ